MSETMVERVARALRRQHGETSLPTFPGDEYWLNQARAAIEALREPTGEMIAAVDAAEDNGHYVAAAFEHIEWRDAWTVAIDAALSPNKETDR